MKLPIFHVLQAFAFKIKMLDRAIQALLNIALPGFLNTEADCPRYVVKI